MDCAKTGALIRRLRLEKNMTQKQLAERLNLSSKTVSKWENGLGCPDISLLSMLSEALEVNLNDMLSGELSENPAPCGNLQKLNYHICPCCGNLIFSTGGAKIACCGRKLQPVRPKKAAPEQKLQVENIEDDWFISADHPMTKQHYISFVALARGDRLELHKLFPEWNLQLRLQKRGHGMLIWHDTQEGLFYQLI